MEDIKPYAANVRALANSRKSVKENCDPVDSSWVGGIAGVAGAHGELAEVGIVEETQGARQQNFGPALSVGDDFSIGVEGGDEARVWMILFGESTGSLVKVRGDELDEMG